MKKNLIIVFMIFMFSGLCLSGSGNNKVTAVNNNNSRVNVQAKANKFSKSATQFAQKKQIITKADSLDRFLSMQEDLRAVTNHMQSLKIQTVPKSASALTKNTIRANVQLNQDLKSRASRQDYHIHKDKDFNTPFFISFNKNNTQTFRKTRSEQLTDVANYLSSMGETLQLKEPSKELLMADVKTDEAGFSHYHYKQYYRDYEVWGADVKVHVNRSGQISAINGRFFPTPVGLENSEFVTSREQCLNVIAGEYQITPEKIHVFNTQKIVYYHPVTNIPTLAWFVETGKSKYDDDYFFIDAITGHIIHHYNNIQEGTPSTGSAKDLQEKTRQLDIYKIDSDYYLLNTTKHMFDGSYGNTISDMQGIILIADAQNVNVDDFNYYYYVSSTNTTNWPANSVSLAYNFSKVYDYYKQVHNLKTLDNQQHNILGIVNMGVDYNNAFWSGGNKLFCFGNGDNQVFSDLAASLDIVAHEYSHGVTQYSSNLEYQFQSGALNEAFSDFMGVFTEYWADPQNADWLIGEDIIPASSDYTCLRNLANPHSASSLTSDYPEKMSEYADWAIEDDNGGVHRNSTIPGHAFYLMSTLMPMDKIEKIIYRSYINYLTRRSEFIDLRLAAIQSATDLYPGTNVATLVGQAFDGVEIYDGSGTEPEEPYEPVSGDQFVLAVLAGNGQILSLPPEIPFESGTETTYPVYTSNKPSITENGDIIGYIDADGNVNIYDRIHNTNSVLSDDGSWHSISISPKGDYLALVPDPDYVTGVIGIADVESGKTSIRDLSIPTTGEDTVNPANYADIMDWSNDGGWLLYDCSYNITDQFGDTYDTWSLFLTNAEDEGVIALFQQDDNELTGNPSFSNTNDNIIVFDYVYYSLIDDVPENYIYTFNLFTGDFGYIDQNINTFGSPSFSTDDTRIVYQDEDDEGTPYLSQAKMANELNAEEGSRQPWVQPLQYPVWYATGTRSAIDTPNKTVGLITDFILADNYPNPFNPETIIKYNVKSKSHVKLIVYSITGQTVKTLVNGNMEPGSYSAHFDASGLPTGVYFYQLNVDQSVITKKMTYLR